MYGGAVRQSLTRIKVPLSHKCMTVRAEPFFKQQQNIDLNG